MDVELIFKIAAIGIIVDSCNRYNCSRVVSGAHTQRQRRTGNAYDACGSYSCAYSDCHADKRLV